jgi:hypothetical protein
MKQGWKRHSTGGKRYISKGIAVG